MYPSRFCLEDKRKMVSDVDQLIESLAGELVQSKCCSQLAINSSSSRTKHLLDKKEKLNVRDKTKEGMRYTSLEVGGCQEYPLLFVVGITCRAPPPRKYGRGWLWESEVIGGCGGRG